jgi:ABC-type sugar transport system ATPase subunit
VVVDISGPPADATPPSGTLIRLSRIRKSYPGVRALNNIDFDLARGEIHGVLGENGAGKSTLIRIIGGATRPDEGEITIDGLPTILHSPQDAVRRGIAVIHQELEVLPALSVTENILLGKLPVAFPGVVDWAAAHRRAAAVLDMIGLAVKPKQRVGALTVAERQLIVIARALATEARAVILDEPTAALDDAEVANLSRILVRLRASGTAIVYVSHRISEVIGLADRITVLRDGRKVYESVAADATIDGLVYAMVGRDLGELYPRRSKQVLGEPVIEVKGLSAPRQFHDVTFDVRAGEVVALFGLLGSGCNALTRTLMGEVHRSAGEIRVGGKALPLRSPTEAQRAGLGLVPLERRREGLVLPLDVATNIVLSSFTHYTRFGVIRRSGIRAAAAHWIQRLSIRTPSAAARVMNLSGGNQQKVILARCLEAKARLVILEEPTRGVDVGAKIEVYRLLDQICGEGIAVLLVSSEVPEVLALADRVIVMSRGQVTAEFGHAVATRELLVANAAA